MDVTTSAPEATTRALLARAMLIAAVLLAAGLGFLWGQRSGSDALELRRHPIIGTVSLADADGFCIASTAEERCARLVYREPPTVGDTVRAEWVAFPSEDEGILLWSDMTPLP